MTPLASVFNICACNGMPKWESIIIFTGCRTVSTSRTLRRGSSSITVPTPVKIAQAWARQWWPSALAKGPVIHWLSPAGSAVLPSRLAAIFMRTQGRPRVIRRIKPGFNSRASASSKPSFTAMPAARNCWIPWPETNGLGSLIAILTLATLAAIKASTQGAVLPVWLQGSSVT